MAGDGIDGLDDDLSDLSYMVYIVIYLICPMCIFYKIVLVFHLEGKSCVSPFLGALVMNNILFCPDMIPGAFLGFLTALFCFASGVGAWPFVFCSKRCLLLLTLQIQYVHLIIWSQVRLLGVWTD